MTEICFRHGRHAGIASITPHLRAYRCGTRECYYILYPMASYVQDVVVWQHLHEFRGDAPVCKTATH
jgi:hypothetical protein